MPNVDLHAKQTPWEKLVSPQKWWFTGLFSSTFFSTMLWPYAKKISGKRTCFSPNMNHSHVLLTNLFHRLLFFEFILETVIQAFTTAILDAVYLIRCRVSKINVGENLCLNSQFFPLKWKGFKHCFESPPTLFLIPKSPNGLRLDYLWKNVPLKKMQDKRLTDQERRRRLSWLMVINVDEILDFLNSYLVYLEYAKCARERVEFILAAFFGQFAWGRNCIPHLLRRK